MRTALLLLIALPVLAQQCPPPAIDHARASGGALARSLYFDELENCALAKPKPAQRTPVPHHHALTWKQMLACDRFDNPVYAIERPPGTPFLVDDLVDAKDLIGTHGTTVSGEGLVLIDHFRAVTLKSAPR